MNAKASEILNAALQLTEQERGELAGRLIESLDKRADQVSPQEIDAAWREEVERRVDQMEAGQGQSVSWPEARKRLRGFKDDATAA